MSKLDIINSDNEKLQNFFQEHSYQCKICGRKETIIKMEKALCRVCKHYIYKDEEKYNKYLFKIRLVKEISKKCL